MEKKKIIINGHEAVDLGLGVKWATCNIGAESPEEYGAIMLGVKRRKSLTIIGLFTSGVTAVITV
jgi:hypothetical protein